MAVSLSDQELTELTEGFESFSRSSSEIINKDFVNTALSLVAERLDGDLDQQRLNKSPSLKMAVFCMALYLYNNRDFQDRLNQEAVEKQVTLLLAPVENLSRNLEDADV